MNQEKKTQADRRGEAEEVLVWLFDQWPHMRNAVFAIGVREQVRPHLPDQISYTHLRRALSWHTGGDDYLKRIGAEGSQRVDIEGNTSPVTAKHRQHAAQTLRPRAMSAKAKQSKPKPTPPAAAKPKVDKLGRPILSLKKSA